MTGRTATLPERHHDGAKSFESIRILMPHARAEDVASVEKFLRAHPAAAIAITAAAPEIAECFGRDAEVTVRVVVDREDGDTRLSLRVKTPDGPRVDRERLAVLRDRITVKPAFRDNDDLLTFGVAFA